MTAWDPPHRFAHESTAAPDGTLHAFEYVIEGLKREPGKDISITGSATLVRSLLRDDLLDELRLLVRSTSVPGSACSTASSIKAA